MKILLAGPRLCSPWTEGRKRLARDLAGALAADHAVRVVTTVDPGETTGFPVPCRGRPASGPVSHFRSLHAGLGEELDEWRPELVCHLPIGSFHGMYGYGNLASMWLAERQCARRSAPCFTLMYAIAREASVERLSRCVSHLLVHPSLGQGVPIRFGTALPEPQEIPAPGDGRSLLFMAGTTQPTRERLDHVLNLRGLATLLRAGRTLAPDGFRLTIAVPLLAHMRLREALRKLPGNNWPESALHILDTITVPEVFAGHDLFVFPYARDETQFVPTSVIEAMHFGLATVLPRLPFLLPIIGEGAHAFAFEANDAEDLARAVRAAASDTARRAAVRDSALAMVRREFAIRGTCEDLLRYYRERIAGAAGRSAHTHP
ncbi:MAG TPA: hypothetical protein DHV08_13450 [Rhodocyclaceae bacterium]|nr:MAG: hypothetical protein AUK49_02335 [Betaproteobacteria bacterium CG2_30_68_42]PIV73290.1 MAG: hypothetical protein COW56_06950 [Rhodocyclales bacterium CG17_big_fil_post_rev_8_21_14_2_50_68_7]PJA57139.1 MAG: hypothetical protein CO164_09520 [Rhodocyclales bacterium CG_4_9_14_3_um_filter_68_10]HCX34439.1 hypothetical protein [Rhodocyclaceae bacterium]